MTTSPRHILSIIVDNDFGVLSRVAALFSSRGYNIESLCVAPDADPRASRITVVTTGSDHVVDQIGKQLRKLLPVRDVQNLTAQPHVGHELALIKVRSTAQTRTRLQQIARQAGASCEALSPTVALLEMTAAPDQIAQLIRELADYKIIEMARSGVVSLSRAG